MTSVIVNVCCERGNTWSRRRKAVTVFLGGFFWVVVHQRPQRRANGLVLQGPASAMLFVPLFYYIIFLVSRPRQAGSGGASGRRTNRRFSMGAAHSHTHTPTPDSSGRLGSVSRRLPLLLSLLPPLPRRNRPSAGERQRRNERLGVVYLRADLAGDDSERRLAGFALFALTLSVAALRGGREAPRRLLSPPAVRPHSPDRLDGNQCRLHGHLTSESEARCVQQRHIRPSLSQ